MADEGKEVDDRGGGLGPERYPSAITAASQSRLPQHPRIASPTSIVYFSVALLAGCASPNFTTQALAEGDPDADPADTETALPDAARFDTEASIADDGADSSGDSPYDHDETGEGSDGASEADTAKPEVCSGLAAGAFCTIESYWCCDEPRCCGGPSKCVHSYEGNPAWGHCVP